MQVTSPANDAEAAAFATQLFNAIRAAGLKVNRVSAFGFGGSRKGVFVVQKTEGPPEPLDIGPMQRSSSSGNPICSCG